MSVSRCGLVFGMGLGLLATGPAFAQSWNAVAFASWHSADGKAHYSVGYSGTRATEEEAKASAIKACASQAHGACEAQGAWDYGCIYITTGSRKTGATYGSGDDAATALKKCREGGYTCKQPIGGCVDEPDAGPVSQVD